MLWGNEWPWCVKSQPYVSIPAFAKSMAKMKYLSIPMRKSPKLKQILPLLLCVLLLSGLTNSALAQTDNGQSEPDRGWNALANVLDALTPSAQTEDPPSGEQVNRAIQDKLDRRQAQAALQEIEARELALAELGGPGRDVQLMFQKARALAQLGKTAEAEAVYREMTIQYPELAEPWNNLAILYISRNDLDQARMALEAAIMNNPRYTAAISNLADLQLLLALQGYEKAASLGDRNARSRAQALRQFIKETNQP
jgi:tetratricopeptide (TPR) repeat protein